MGKKAKNGQRTKNDSMTEADGKAHGDEKLEGCVSPAGCTVGTPIDPNNPGDSIKMICSNTSKCTVNKFVHAQCFEELETQLLRALDCHAGQSRRGSTWTEQQKVANLWMKKGYEVLYKLCRCPCSGFLRKDIDYRPPVVEEQNGAAAAAVGGGNGEKKKKKDAKPVEKALPKLNLQQAKGYGARNWMVATERHESAATGRMKDNSGDGYIPGLYPLPESKPVGQSSQRKQPSFDDAFTDEKDALPWQRLDRPMVNGYSGHSSSHTSPESKGDRSRRESLDNTAKLGHFSIREEISNVQELLSLIDAYLPNGTYRQPDLDDRVNEILQDATVEILGAIADEGGFWEWIGSTENGIKAPFQLTVDEDGMVTKKSLAVVEENGVKCEERNDAGDENGAYALDRKSRSREKISTMPCDAQLPESQEPAEPPFVVDPDLKDALDAHASLTPNSFDIWSPYGDVLDEVRALARQMGAKTFW